MPPAEHPASGACSPQGEALPRVVLDTNVVLDWLLFRDEACSQLAQQLQARQLAWFATAPMRAELLGVLSRPRLSAWRPDTAQMLRVFDDLATLCPTAAACGPTLVCRDADDQKFIDLAVAVDARWLFSKDRALLALARRAQGFGLRILRPDQWPG
jgi:putative PIN family toxin of toxin-antitoxin system